MKSYFTLEGKDNRGKSAAILTDGFSLAEGSRMTGGYLLPPLPLAA